ncbi:MAG: hypothetical protein ACOY3P_18255 [Planctomycetota bacterium]
MPASEKTFYNLNRLHGVFALSAIALLAASVWMVVDDHARPWRAYQEQYREQAVIEARADDGDQTAVPPEELPRGIEQIWLPGLPLDYHFRRVTRTDRCTTCHLGMVGVPSNAADGSEPAPQPFAAHPRLDLFLSEDSPHPLGEFGCTICHDGQGSATDFVHAAHTPNTLAEMAKWTAEHGWSSEQHWNLPMLPDRFTQSRCLSCHFEITDVGLPFDQPSPAADKLLAGYEVVRRHGCYGCHEINGFDAQGQQIGPDMRLEPRGAMRKLGPNLKDIDERLNAVVLGDRIADPRHLLPEGRMPQVFGLWEHLEGETLAAARELESAELVAIVAYLMGPEKPDDISPPTGTLPGSVERGQEHFARQGCAACHKHAAFPEVDATQGPDLTNVGAKYRAPGAAAWLARWIQNPAAHAPRTLMPQALFEPEPTLAVRPSEPADAADAPGSEDAAAAEISPPTKLPVELPPAVVETRSPHPIVADLAAFLLESTRGIGSDAPWQPHAMPPLEPHALRALAAQYLPEPLPEDQQQFLVEVGQRAILRRGCVACHEIPGIEQAPMIGPALTDWGRKPPQLLAFEHVGELAADPSGLLRLGATDQPATLRPLVDAAQGPGIDDADEAYFVNALRQKRRDGFLWQKIRAPRSFDYRIAAEKPYRQWLTMPRFSFTPDEREAVMTFVLGLTVNPPAPRYVPNYSAERSALIEGERLLEQYACTTCHTVAMDRWTVRYRPGELPAPPPTGDYHFVVPQIPPQVLAESARAGPDGYAATTLTGRPRTDPSGQLLEDEDEDGHLLYYFTLWEPAVLDGNVWRVGGPDVPVPAADLLARQAPRGGAYARFLYPRVVAEARTAGATAGDEAWGWVPPPLVIEGARIRGDWIRSYVLNPQQVRPACALRMPRYAMTIEEADTFARYFSAATDAKYPEPAPLPAETTDPKRAELRNEALSLILDRTTYCAKCHVIGDYRPGGGRTILAPNLERVEGRFRPDALRRWLANPKTQIPYTAMPVNFPPSGEPISKDVFPASSHVQLDAVADLLLNYGEFLRSRFSVQPLMDGAASDTTP